MKLNRARSHLDFLAATHRTSHPTPHPTTSFLTATKYVYATGAGITAAAGTRLALQLILDKRFNLFSFQLINLLRVRSLLFIVTTSLCQDWVICAPAAFLGSGSRFSGSLSEIVHPYFVTRHNHSSPLYYRPKCDRADI